MDHSPFFLEAGRRLQEVMVVYLPEAGCYRYLWHQEMEALSAYFPVTHWREMTPPLPFPQAALARKELEAAMRPTSSHSCSHSLQLSPSQAPPSQPSWWSSLLRGRFLRLEELWKAYLHHLLATNSPPSTSSMNWPPPILLSSFCTDFFRLVQQSHWRGQLEWLPGIELDASLSKRKWRQRHRDLQPVCQRCGATGSHVIATPCAHCEDCFTCQACASLGSVKRCTLLLQGVAPSLPPALRSSPSFPRQPSSTEHNGLSLTPAQQAAAQRCVESLQAHPWQGKSTQGDPVSSTAQVATSTQPHLLLWAVCGAGKTEVLLRALAWALAQGLQIAVTTPRKDVVLELLPRLQQYFPQVEMAALYGGHQSWQLPPLLVCTTHQLLRFRHAFHLLILDEMDAFPYQNSPFLPRVVRRALHPQGFFLALTATPARKEQEASRRGHLPTITIPVRYHHHPLPVPRLCLRSAHRLRLPRPIQSFFRWLEGEWGRGEQLEVNMEESAPSLPPSLFLFVPRKHELPQLQAFFQALTSLEVEATHADDPARLEKVLQFRQKEFPILLCTSLLERGITIPHSHVVVWDAETPIWDEAALVQMAGRAGRNQQYPHGQVFFVVRQPNRSVRHAIKHLERMNRIAKQEGYLP